MNKRISAKKIYPAGWAKLNVHPMIGFLFGTTIQ